MLRSLSVAPSSSSSSLCGDEGPLGDVALWMQLLIFNLSSVALANTNPIPSSSISLTLSLSLSVFVCFLCSFSILLLKLKENQRRDFVVSPKCLSPSQIFFYRCRLSVSHWWEIFDLSTFPK